MYVADRISRWAMGVGVRQLTLSHESGFKFADHLRHLHHHLKALRVERVWNTRGMNDVQLSLHLLECSKVLSKISFEASLIPLDYVERVGWSVTSHIDRTFVTETRTPKWNLEITMSNPQETSIVNVTYNLDGSLFEY